MDHAGGAVGREQQMRGRIEREAAERRARIGRALEGHVGEQADLAADAVDAPDRAGTAACIGRPEQAGHEGRIGRALLGAGEAAASTGRDDRQAVDRGRRHVDVRRRRVVERHREHLADLRGRRRERLRRAQELRLRLSAGRLQIDDAHRRAGEIDLGEIRWIAVRRRRGRLGAGESGHRRIAGREDSARVLGGRDAERCGQQHGG
jgi:hypothetical protein